MSGSTTSPSMVHSPAYHGNPRTPNLASSAYSYPQSSSPPPPPTAHVNRSRCSPGERYSAARAHVKTSVSSATSGSSAVSDYKSPVPEQPYRFSSQAEKGMIEDPTYRHPHLMPSGRPLAATSHISQNSRHPGARSEMVEADPAVIRYIAEQDIEDDGPQEKDHAIWILFWLSCLDPFHSFFSCIFSIVILISLVLLSPFRFCQQKWSFSTSLIRTICPVFRNHLQLIYAPSVKNAHNFEFSPTALILVHVLSPFVSLAIAFWSWVMAVFWLFTLIMGNPDGTEKRDDGRATVLMTRNKYEKFLYIALRER